MDYEIEVAHDTRLLELLTEQGEAVNAYNELVHRAIRAAATAYVSHERYRVVTLDGEMVRGGMTRDDLPVGTVYEQAKTFTRGEQGYYIVTDDEGWSRYHKARITDLAGRLTAEQDAALAEAQTAITATRDAIVEHEQGYTGWNRYFLVTSSAGHVHRSMHCGTCYPTTAYAPVVALSGHTDGEAVEMLGETLCTVCFPDAPVAGRVRKLTAAAARKLVAA